MQFTIYTVVFILGIAVGILVASRSTKLGQGFISPFDGWFTRQPHDSESGCLPGQSEKTLSVKNHDGIARTCAENLLTKQQVEDQYDMDSWQRLAYEEFKSTILAKGSGQRQSTFPCIYATMGYRNGDHRYVFLHSDDLSEPRNVRSLAPALRSYLRLSHSLGDNTSIVIFGAPNEGKPKSLLEYQHDFWEMLRNLHILDTAPWPEDIPQDTEHQSWTFCFDGTPVFPVALTPVHQRRWSRHAPVHLVALQPKWVLDKLLSTPENRERAIGKVRKLLSAYDQVNVSPDLTTYGMPGTSEAHQLYLWDENNTAKCPYANLDEGSLRSLAP